MVVCKQHATAVQKCDTHLNLHTLPVCTRKQQEVRGLCTFINQTKQRAGKVVYRIKSLGNVLFVFQGPNPLRLLHCNQP
jgi:hypothetical protein